jgi:hypothetical protein
MGGEKVPQMTSRATSAALERALIGLFAVIFAGCAVPYREPQPDWGGISREAGKIINR